jgi:nucleotide-binding universal stress UspA family protein
MKILVAYDGSAIANTMLDDLRRSGIPSDAKVEVVTVAESWFPLPTSYGGVDTSFTQESLTGVDRAKGTAKYAAEYLERICPTWEIGYAAASGSPASILLGHADDWHPDLIALGAHGHAALSTLFLGNVAQKVANEARCSVRISRTSERDPKMPIRLVIGMDGSRSAEAAVAAVAGRHWPAGTEVRIVNAIWKMPPPSPDAERHENIALQISEWVAAENGRIDTLIKESIAQLQAVGLSASSVVREEDPKRLLIAEAEEWNADTIFLGARGRSRLERLLLGSVSSHVAMRASCSVEIVRG